MASNVGQSMFFTFVVSAQKPLRSGAAIVACVFSAIGLGCMSDNPAPAPTIRIIAPVAQQHYQMADTVTVIAECDYSKFASGINVDFSVDSSKTWNLIQSRVRKEGVQKDTLKWVPSIDHPGMVAAGPGVLVQVYDYNKKFVAKSGFFFFTP